MYDMKVLHVLDNVLESIGIIQQRTENILCVDDFWIQLPELYCWMRFV